MEYKVFIFRPLQFWNQNIYNLKFCKNLICTILSLLFGRYVQRCINFKFEICTDNLPIIAHFCRNLPSFSENVWSGNSLKHVKLCILEGFMHNKHGYLMQLYVFLFIVFQNECINFSKTSLWEAVHQINLILWFYGFKTCKDNSYVNKLNLFITKIRKIGYSGFQ